jgi:hypothetical protein
MESDPGNAMSKNSYAISLRNRAHLLVKTGDRAGALALYREALAIFRQLLSLDPQSPWRQDLCAETQAAIAELSPAHRTK